MELAARSERLASLGHLASGVAHEIRTPLTSLKLFLQSVQDNITFSPDDREDYQIAMRQVGRIEKTINRFLEFARPQDPVVTEFDFAQLAEEVLEVIRPRASHQEVEIRECLMSEPAWIKGDAHQLSEVLVNLLVNALDVMPDGGQLTFSIDIEKETDNRHAASWVVAKISDTGPGIRQQDLERVFEPFFTTKATGSGLGLAILKGTVESHGGSVHVDTCLRAGTTFCIRLPALSQEKTVEHEQDPDCG